MELAVFPFFKPGCAEVLARKFDPLFRLAACSFGIPSEAYWALRLKWPLDVLVVY